MIEEITSLMAEAHTVYDAEIGGDRKLFSFDKVWRHFQDGLHKFRKITGVFPDSITGFSYNEYSYGVFVFNVSFEKWGIQFTFSEYSDTATARIQGTEYSFKVCSMLDLVSYIKG